MTAGLYNAQSMSAEPKPIVSKETTFDQMEIRVGRVIQVSSAAQAPRPSYVIKADFGKFGIRTSVGRFTMHDPRELIGRQILGVVNFEPRRIGGVVSEFLCFGVQYPQAVSGEATPVAPLTEAKLGSKLF